MGQVTYENLQMAWAVFATILGMVALSLLVLLLLYALYKEPS